LVHGFRGFSPELVGLISFKPLVGRGTAYHDGNTWYSKTVHHGWDMREMLSSWDLTVFSEGTPPVSGRLHSRPQLLEVPPSLDSAILESNL
jgi:hypothetical protein